MPAVNDALQTNGSVPIIEQRLILDRVINVNNYATAGVGAEIIFTKPRRDIQFSIEGEMKWNVLYYSKTNLVVKEVTSSGLFNNTYREIKNTQTAQQLKPWFEDDKNRYIHSIEFGPRLKIGNGSVDLKFKYDQRSLNKNLLKKANGIVASLNYTFQVKRKKQSF